MTLRIGDRFALGKALGSGSFGQIFEGKELRTGRRVAIKLEPLHAKHPQLQYEYRLYRALGGGAGIPAVHWCGQEGQYRVLVMDRLGANLEQLFTQCRRRFSLKTVLMLADQMLARLEYVHSKQFVHRDIKPDNFLMGRGPFENVVFLVDYGLAKRFVDPTTGEHIPFREDKQLTGTARYASLHAHLGKEQSRRDDLEALGNVWLYFLRGKLPWQGLHHSDAGHKYKDIKQCKLQLSLRELCAQVPREFYEYFKLVRRMEFEDTPNYAALRRLFSQLMHRQGYTTDYQFDWKMPLAGLRAGPRVQASAPSSVPHNEERGVQVVELLH